LAALAPIAHLLELPNKLDLPGPLWLGIQQNLYRGWGLLIGAPTEIAALAASLALCLAGHARHGGALAVVAYLGMLAVFFLFNNPVNIALDAWTPETLPSDWPAYRARWETGHALAAMLSLIGFLALLRLAVRKSCQSVL
jgi:hypothetical protein